MAEIIGDEPCPSCREQGGDKTGNHLILFDDGGKHCNRCGYTVRSGEQYEVENEMYSLADVVQFPVKALEDRGISKEVATYFGVHVAVSDTDGVTVTDHFYPYHKKGALSGYKQRHIEDKAFFAVGDTKECEMFGQHLAPAGGKLIIITEGECDAMAATEMLWSLGKKYRVVSLASGASANSIKNNLEWLETFKNVILAFDQDGPGKKAAEEVSALLTPGKVKVMSFDEKDPNDMLRAGKAQDFYKALAGAAMHRPDGIISGGDTWAKLKERPAVESTPFPADWTIMNQKTYGIRVGELDTITSGSGMGKTQKIRELQLHLLDNTPSNLGIIALEEPLHDSVEALMALRMNKRIQLPDVRETVSEEEMYEAWLSTSGTNRVHFYDHFGSVDDDSLVTKIRFLARAMDCKYIFLDHLSIVVSEFADQGGERERIDTIMTRLKNLTQELDIWIGLVVHLRKTSGGGKSFEEGGVPTLDDLRGSGSIKQLSNSVYALSRNQQHSNDAIRNTSHLHVLKCRFTGRTGDADWLFFNDETGRMEATNDPFQQDEEDEDHDF